MIPQIGVDIRPAKDYLHRLTQRELPRVIGRSLDRTASSGKTFLSRRVRERFALKKAVVDRSISKRRSSEIASITALNLGRAWFELRVSGDPIPLRDYNARQTRRGLTYQVSRKVGRKTYTAAGQPAFIVARFGNHVFVRKGADPAGSARVGIRKVFGPSLPQSLHRKKERAAVIAHCEQVWATEVVRNARYALSKR